MAKERMKLKKELQKIMDVIFEEDDYGNDKARRAIRTLYALKEFHFKKLASLSSKGKGVAAVPHEFLCPLSGEPMINPVAVASGETYDERFIRKWFREVSETCPKTKKILHNTSLTTNRLVQKIIKQWCTDNKMKLPNPHIHSGPIPVPDQDDDDLQDNGEETEQPAGRTSLDELLDEMSSPSLSIQKKAARVLKELTSHILDFRKLFSSENIFRMLNPLLSGSADVDPVLREDLVSTIYNISTDPGDKKIVSECPAVIPILNASLLCGTADGKINSAAALELLAELHSNKVLIGRSGAIKNLISLFKEVDESSDIVDVSDAIFALCENLENRAKAVDEGFIWVVLEKIMSKVCVDELLSMLAAQFVGDQKTVEEMAKLGAVPMCFELIRDSSSSAGAKENCLRIITSIYSKQESQWKFIVEEEETHGTLSALERNGPSARMKRAAVRLLKSKPGSSDRG